MAGRASQEAMGGFYSTFIQASRGDSEAPRSLLSALVAAALEHFQFLQRHCLPALLLALLWKLRLGLNELYRETLATLLFTNMSWTAQEALWRDVYWPLRPRVGVHALAVPSWRAWAPLILDGEHAVSEMMSRLRGLRLPQRRAAASRAPARAADLLRIEAGSSCMLRTRGMVAYEVGPWDGAANGSLALFYRRLLVVAERELKEWRVLSAGSLLHRLTLEVQRSIEWTWSHCAPAVFLALSVQVLLPLERALTSMMTTTAFADWHEDISRADQISNQVLLPLRPVLLRHWRAWSGPPHWARPLRLVEDRIVYGFDALATQRIDRVAELERLCAGAQAADGSVSATALCRRAATSIDASTFDQQMKRAFELAVGVLERLGAEFWPVGGTLFGALRYGNLAGQLADGKVDCTDDDLEFMVGVRAGGDWQVLSSLLEFQLTGAGFQNCIIAVSEPNNAYRRRLRSDTLVCGFYDTYAISLELRSYIVGPGFAYQHALHDIPDCAESSARRSFLCFAHELPYLQAWKGMLPLELLYPLRQCQLYNHTVPCPADPVAILRGWNGGEYELPGYCLAVPLLTDDRKREDPRNQLLAREGLSALDLRLLQHYARGLDAAGFASFLPQWKEGGCPPLASLQQQWARGRCPPARARPQDLA